MIDGHNIIKYNYHYYWPDMERFLKSLHLCVTFSKLSGWYVAQKGITFKKPKANNLPTQTVYSNAKVIISTRKLKNETYVVQNTLF